MTLYPPVTEITDKELFNMISNDKKWSKEAADQAYFELQKRNYSVVQINNRKEKLQKILFRFENRVSNQRKANTTVGYTIGEILLVIIGLPFRLITNGNLLSFFWNLDKYNYKKKTRQRAFLVVIAIIFWLFILRIIFSLA